MIDDRGPYKVLHMNRHIITLADIDTARDFVLAHGGPEDWEILNGDEDA